ncbi:RNA polymerase-associated protein RapA [Marinomonas mediterranea]|jgi:Superfamily II DNA/RNA helicases, SNF2 family|uniref:RNA polymerase-associated protein RapA n=1 Tax=Marinomonas mediterranea (strain ATCC 700492 / JCM 21426 / NBRC 103028 / MMB-1) TaxID=717774 RepID=F2K1L0_MARM1|nr:RNA polymerase-associated protein RapA [Marinomonas mediterranea]ADZ92240.1 SNF2-related protein [Marinomonas mediterranea MMB-1]WCN18298.1 RNA polymerase-associated protein RapA [Marinomonas mediterranea MMB-1]
MYQTGQRWSSRNEPDLGVGTIIETQSKSFTLFFSDSEIERNYSVSQTSLVRRTLTTGDQLLFENEAFTVSEIKEVENLMFYKVGSEWLDESEISFPRNDKNELDSILALSPARRMWFDLRRKTLEHQALLAASPVRGLMGLKAELLPHQIYLAHDIANRPRSRALLCDEVGMGKTLEAGLILHHRVMNGLSKRALILTPTNLQHQWLVEMLRRFHQPFSLINESVYEDFMEGDDNPFDQQPFVIAPIDFVCQHGKAAQHMIASEWDIVIVDEAHHLSWDPETPSIGYQLVARLAANTESLLLLSATPEQTGEREHFSRLQLIDPDRYHDFEAYQAQQGEFKAAAELAEALLPLTEEGFEPSDTDWKTLFGNYLENVKLKDWFENLESKNTKARIQAAKDAISWLIDQHGTGREVFRNTRAAIGGFPERHLNTYPLENNEHFDSATRHVLPEMEVDHGLWELDPRWIWLKEFLECQADKVLVICHTADMAQWLNDQLTFAGFQSADFHEQMPLIHRDRAAAYFADDDGAQILVCSEIGSEGRNFQFSHNLVMYDLPEHPDLLEQRIGRLDRLGQRNTVEIHIPYIKNSVQERLFQWYHHALNAFERTTSAGDKVNMAFKEPLHAFITGQDDDKSLLLEANAFHDNLLKQMDEGRNRLLEMSSCRPDRAAELINQINDEATQGLHDYIEQVTHAFNIYADCLNDAPDQSSWFLRPSSDMMVEALPGIDDDGKALMLNRRQASQREDVAFATWEHPLINMLMDEVQSFDSGKLTSAILPIAALPEGTVLLETMFVIEASAHPRLKLAQSLPMTPIWQLSDKNAKFLHSQFTADKWAEKLKGVPNRVAEQWVAALRKDLIELLQAHQLNAQELARPMVHEAKEDYKHRWQSEINRLCELRTQNKSVSQEDIDLLETNLSEGLQRIDEHQIRLDAIRIILTTKPE